MRSTGPHRLAAVMAAHPKVVLMAVLVATVAFGVAASEVRIDNNFAALFASDSEEALFRQDHRDRWGPDDGLLVAVVQAGDGTSTEAVTGLIEDLTASTAAAIPALERVESVTSADVLAVGPDGQPLTGPAFGEASPFDLPVERRVDLAHRSRLGAADLLSDDGRTFLVVGVLYAEYDSHETVVGPAEEFEAAVERLAGASGLDVTTRFSGVAYTRIAAIDLMQSDLLKLSPLATLGMAVILWAVFRRAAAVIGPILSIGASLVATAGIIGLAGDDLNQVTIIYPILMMGVVVSSSTHLVHRFYRERAAGLDAADAGRVVWEGLSRPAFFASVTTAIGFASLVVAEMRILHEFGLYLAFGVLAAFVLHLCVVPAVLIVADSHPHDAYRDDESETTPVAGGRTERYARWMLRPRAAAGVLVLGVAAVIGSGLVARTAVFDYVLTDMLADDHPVSEGNTVIDEELSGVIPIEISLQGMPGTFTDPDLLVRMDHLATWLEEEHDIEVVALSQAVEEVLTVSGAGAGSGDVWADNDSIRAALDAVLTFRDGAYARTLVTEDASFARIQGFSPDRGGRYVVDLAESFEQEAEWVLRGTNVTARMTGEAPVAYDGMNSLTRELVVSTLLALAMIVVAVLLVFRNGWLTLVAVLPNVAPIMLALAAYRLSRDILDPLPGIVLCIAIGLAADDTIHLINRWRELRREDPTLGAGDALVTSVVTLRRAMVTSTIVLVAGFLTLTLSGFGWNAQLGALGSLVLVLALGADLVFGVAGLALLARRLDRRRSPALSPPVQERDVDRVWAPLPESETRPVPASVPAADGRAAASLPRRSGVRARR
jgi:uncharacterized protein